MDETRTTDNPTILIVEDDAYGEIRYRTLAQSAPERAAVLIKEADRMAKARFNYYKQLAAIDWATINGEGKPPEAAKPAEAGTES